MPFSIVGNRTELVEKIFAKIINEAEKEKMTNGEYLELLSYLFENVAGSLGYVVEAGQAGVVHAKALAGLLLAPICPGDVVNVPTREDLPEVLSH